MKNGAKKNGIKAVPSLDEAVTRLLNFKNEAGEIPSMDDRKKMVTALIDEYLAETGQVPLGPQIQRLANWLLYESLTDKNPDKVTKEEYPILTKRQLKVRCRRERANEHIAETHTVLHYLGGTKQKGYDKSLKMS